MPPSRSGCSEMRTANGQSCDGSCRTSPSGSRLRKRPGESTRWPPLIIASSRVSPTSCSGIWSSRNSSGSSSKRSEGPWEATPPPCSCRHRTGRTWRSGPPSGRKKGSSARSGFRWAKEWRGGSPPSGALRSVTAALIEAVSIEEVAAIVVENAAATVGAVAGMMALLTDDGHYLEIKQAAGYPQEMLRAWHRFPLDAPLPLSEAVRTGRPVLLESVAARRQRYPDLESMLQLPDHALVAIPMSIEGRPLGGLVFRFEDPRRFAENEVDFMVAMGRQAALALERARLYEAEQQARNQAELAQVRLAFLAEAGAILSRSLQMPDALDSLGRLAVTFLTDLCLIDVIGEDGSLRRMVAVHADAEKQP